MTQVVAGLLLNEGRIAERQPCYPDQRHSSIPTEKAFSDLWERSLELRPRLIGRGGETYEVLFPGVRNQGAGPDFKGAVLRRDGTTIGGDIELHLDSSGWRAHGHHKDSGYDGVVLQVVLKARPDRGGAPVPPTAEAKFELEDDGRSGPLPTREVPDLEELGLRRFLAKSAGFRLELESASSPDQVLFESLLDAMGYARNRKPFRSLAKRVPYETFSRLSCEPISTAEFAIFSALAVGGGLSSDLEHSERIQARRIARRMGVRSVRSPGDWSRFRVRPSNAPISRIKGIASFLAKSIGDGLVETLESVFDRESILGLVRDVENRPYIGRGLAVTVVANVLVPALHAVSLSRNAGEHRRIEKAFSEMPSPPQDAVTRGISAVLGLDIRPSLAIQHFGLHALARSRSWPGAKGSAA